MTGEIITLEVGQCGNNIGKQLWSQLIKEHGIGPDGRLIDDSVDSTSKIRDDDTNPFFRQYEEDRYTPRALMFDLVPGIINDALTSLPGLFDLRNQWVSESKSGAGDAWARGYDEGRKNQDLFLNMIDRELDSTDRFEGFQILHSVAGGTGSGLGSNLLEALSDRYSKKLITTYSVFPSDQSENVVQPYNTILTLQRLEEQADVTVVFDNNALSNVSAMVFQRLRTDYGQINQLITSVMSSITNPIRLPSYMYTSLPSIFSTLVPTPELHFLTSSFTPYTSDYITDGRDYKRKTAYDVLLELVDSSNSLVSIVPEKLTYLNVFSSILGDVDTGDVSRAIYKLQRRLRFPKWSSSAIHVNVGRRSPYLPPLKNGSVTGVMLANSSGIVPILQKSCKLFDTIYSKRAFLSSFRELDFCKDDDFVQAREVGRRIVEEYTASTEETYLDEVLIEDENFIGY